MDGDIEFYRWSFGDGISKSQTTLPQHIYTNPGTYDVKLIIIDNGGRSNTTKTTATISSFSKPNIAPIADIGGPYSIDSIGNITFNASKSEDSDGIINNYTWDFGDDSIGYGSLVVHNYTENGTYTVTLKITDDDGDIDTIFTTVTVGLYSSRSIENNIIKNNEILFIVGAAVIILIIIIGFIIWRKRKD